MTVTVKDRGARRFLAKVKRAQKGDVSVDVGVIGDEALRLKAGGITVADVATWAELGLGQPQRSWLRGYIDANMSEIGKVMNRELQRAHERNQDLKRALDRIGVWLVGEIRERISNGINPPNAPSTIAQKGSSTPLVDTGQFRSSITSRTNV